MPNAPDVHMWCVSRRISHVMNSTYQFSPEYWTYVRDIAGSNPHRTANQTLVRLWVVQHSEKLDSIQVPTYLGGNCEAVELY